MTKDIKDRFIVSEEVSQDHLRELAERTLAYGRVTKEGTVVIDNKKLSRENTLKLALVIRYIANQFDDSIAQSLRPTDLTTTLNERVESVGSRLSKLAKEGFAKKVGYGQYSVFPYKVGSFLDHLERRGDTGETNEIRRRGSSGTRKPKELTGIGVDIQKMIDSGFFDVPRFMNEIDTELKRETRYHDPKVLDMTIRKTFVDSRRSLKRIPNTEGGKAKWRYTVRH